MTRTFQGRRKSSRLANSVLFVHVSSILDCSQLLCEESVRTVMKCVFAVIDGASNNLALQRPQNLEKLSLEELHQRKHDLKQEDF